MAWLALRNDFARALGNAAIFGRSAHTPMRETSRRVAHHLAQQLGRRLIVAGARSTRISTFLDSWLDWTSLDIKLGLILLEISSLL
jgi:hypothetical protein